MIHTFQNPRGDITFRFAEGTNQIEVTRASILSNTVSTRTITATWPEIEKWIAGLEVQRALPKASADDREFLVSGITPEEWTKTFGAKPE